MNATDTRKQLKSIIEGGLKNLPIPQTPENLYEPLRYTLSNGGKRIRPVLVLLANGMCEGSLEEGVPAALAIELLHNFTLVHDDIMDRADVRRGKPSVFKKWNESVAILSGDAMFVQAMKQINHYGTDDRYTKQQFELLNDLFLDAIETVCEGQALDLEFENREQVGIDQYLDMISKKTAALLSISLQLGGITAHADAVSLNALKNIGLETGIAFQIQDDLLDVVGEPDKFGKQVAGDIYEGKKTYLSLMALERAERADRNWLKDLLLSKRAEQDDIERVIALYKKLDVIEDTKKAVEYHYKTATAYLDHFDESIYSEELSNLLKSLINREH